MWPVGRTLPKPVLRGHQPQTTTAIVPIYIIVSAVLNKYFFFNHFEIDLIRNIFPFLLNNGRQQQHQQQQQQQQQM